MRTVSQSINSNCPFALRSTFAECGSPWVSTIRSGIWFGIPAHFVFATQCQFNACGGDQR